MSDIYTLFEKQVKKNPDKVAVEYKKVSITYLQLYKKTIAIANAIYNEGIRKNDVVIVYMSNSIETVSSILAIHKVGAICLPVDTDTPLKRIETILSISNAKLILCDKTVDDSWAVKYMIVSPDMDCGSIYEIIMKDTAIRDEDNAYCIFTSGSTGVPKGVLIKHNGLLNHIKSKIDLLKLNGDNIICQSFSIGFVASIWQILTPLFIGAKLIIYDDYEVKNIYNFVTTLEYDRVDVVSLIPQSLKLLLTAIESKMKPELKNIKYILLTGSQLNPELVNQFYSLYSGVKLINAYGLSECSDDILHYEIPYATDYKSIPIGTPIENIIVDVRDENNNLVPQGEVGELCVKGICLASGYINKNVMGNRFIEDFHNKGDRIYKTGDIVKLRTDGLFEYVGRIDNQIKLRGYRIELDEIEKVIEQYQNVLKACVVLQENDNDSSYLIALFTSMQDIDSTDLSKHVQSLLPSYMCPATFVRMQEFDYTINGKMDRKAITCRFFNTKNKAIDISAPTLIEEKILEIITKYVPSVLAETIHTESEFMNIGIDSMNYFKLILDMEREFDIEFDEEQINFRSFVYVSDMIDYIKQKVDNKHI